MKNQAKKIVNEESSEGAKMENNQKIIKKIQPIPTAQASGPEGGCKPSGN